MNKDDVATVDRELGDGDERAVCKGLAVLIGESLLVLIGIVLLIGRGGLVKYAELAPVGPPSDKRFVSATTLRKAGLLIASTRGWLMYRGEWRNKNASHKGLSQVFVEWVVDPG